MRVRGALGSALGVMVLALPLWLGTTSPAEAGRGRRFSPPQSNLPTYVQPKPYSAPELDPSAAGAAAIVLVGSALVLFDRRRRQA
jgi:hypothetical protein